MKQDRARQWTPRRGRRGFTMLEVAVAGSIFLLVGAVLGLALVTDVGTRAESYVRNQLTADIIQAEGALANGSYNSLLANTFTPPSACSGTGTGTAGHSCYVIGGATYSGSWAVAPGSGAGTSLVVTGSASLASGAVISESRIVAAPALDYSPSTGTVRITVANDPTGWSGTGPLYLLEQSHPSVVVASGSVTNGVAVLTGSPSACTLASPCVVGLSSGNDFATNGTVTEIPSEVWGTGSGVVLTAGGLTDDSIHLTGIGTATIDLNATNTNTGTTSSNAVAGSVCLYLNFNDGVAAQSVPVCNFTSAGSLSVTTYAPDASNPSTVMPLPVGVAMTLSTDKSDGSCPYVTNAGSGPAGTQGQTSGGWANEAVCTSWTWGNPVTATLNGVVSQWGATTLTLSSGTTVTGQIIWKGQGLGASSFVADSSNNVIRLLTSSGNVSTWAGNGTAGLSNGPAASAEFNNPTSVAVASDGTVYVADTSNNVVRAISPGGDVTTLASGFSSPSGLVLNPAGTYLYVSDTGHNQIDKVDVSTGTVTVLAGTGTSGYHDGSGSSATFSAPHGITMFGGNIYVADSANNAIREVASTGDTSTLAGTGSSGSTNGSELSATFNAPQGITVDSGGDFFVADTGNNMIREISSGGVVSTFSGQTTSGFTNGTAGVAQFHGPSQITDGLGGVLYVADAGNNVVRAITSGGVASTLAGTGTAGSANGLAASATFSGDSGVTSGTGWVSAQPAIGYGTVSTWSGPRLVQTCSGSGTCTSIATSVPENTTCPGQACYSGSAPVSAWVSGRRLGVMVN